MTLIIWSNVGLHIDHEYCTVFRFLVMGALMNTVLLLYLYDFLTKPLSLIKYIIISYYSTYVHLFK